MAFEALRHAIEAETAAFAARITEKALGAFAGELVQQLRGPFATAAAPVPAPAPVKAKVGRPLSPKGPCNMKDCKAKVVAKGLCSKHYQKQRERLKAKAATAAEANGAAAPVTA